MMRQYLELKEKYQDCILFFRLGDFYEMFFDDAKLASKELELTLTGKDCGLSERAPMCGVPYHAASAYISRLIEKGYKVAVCEQLTDPALSKGLVERDVIRIVTPGTVADPSQLDEKSACYVLCVAFVGKAAALAYADVSTGELIAHLLNDAQRTLRDELMRIRPREIVTNDMSKLTPHLGETISCTVLPDSDFQKKNAQRALLEHFKVPSLTALGLDERDRRYLAAGALLIYLNDTQKNALPHLTQLTIYQGERTMFLDRMTRRNLELVESLRAGERRGSLLWLLDRTHTAMGARLLRSWVENPMIDRKAIETRLDAVEALKDNYMAAEEMGQALENVADMERLLGKISYNSLTARDCLALLRSLKAVAPVKELLGRFETTAIQALAHTLTPLESLCDLLERAIDPDAPILLSDGGVIRAGYSAELDEYRDAAANGKQWILNLEAAERQETGIKNLRIQYNRVFGYYIEVTKSNLDLVPLRYSRKQTLAGAERYVTPELQEIEHKILNAQQMALTLESTLFASVREAIAAEIGAVQQNAIEIIFDIDVGDGIKRITAAAGNGLEGQIARIGIVAFARLADLDAVGAAGAVAPQGKAGAHVGFDPVMGQRDRTGGTAETHRERAAAGNEFARGGNAVVAHHRQIQPGGITQRGKVDPHHAVHGRGPRAQRRGSHLHVAYRSGGGIRRAACRQHDGDCAKGQHCAQPLPYVLWHLGRSSLAWFVILS